MDVPNSAGQFILGSSHVKRRMYLLFGEQPSRFAILRFYPKIFVRSHLFDFYNS